MALHIADLVEHAVDVVPGNTALIVNEESLTYRELDEAANRIAHFFRGEGIGPAAHIGLFSRNTIEHVVVMLAALKIRATPINLNYRYTATELAYVAESGDLDAIFFERGFEATVATAVSGIARVRHFLVAEDGSSASGQLDAIDYSQALAAGSPHRDFGPRSPDDLYILFTGGTTGYPKGVMWRHEDIWRVLGGGIDFISGERLGEFDQAERARVGPSMMALPLSPLSHGAAVWATWMHLFAGHTTILLNKFDPITAWNTIDRHTVQIVFMTGDAMGRPLIEAYEAGGFDGSSLVAVASSAAVFSETIKRKWMTTFPNVMFTDSVGATEVGSSGVGLLTEDSITAEGPVVALAPGTIVVDDDNNIIDPDAHVGRIVRTGRAGHVPLGYYGDEEKSKATFFQANGVRYAITGDYARVEEGRRLTLLGRGSGCINTGGEKVFPEQVEMTLKSHPDVYDALVVGVPDERWGNRVSAVIQPRAGTRPTVASIQQHVRKHLAGFKVPRSIVLVDEMPRHVTGKANYPLAKQILLEALASGEPSHVENAPERHGSSR
ncbi:acyl-CoA synthetase [Mycobacterium avium]|uniref:acyl-CoA synthetase n=1 Tax=Mycobacterium avium TaxID=1764 RepID=UPI000CE4BD1A|nr:acyl-CoA synthetase [Mycobacterium avium]